MQPQAILTMCVKNVVSAYPKGKKRGFMFCIWKIVLPYLCNPGISSYAMIGCVDFFLWLFPFIFLPRVAASNPPPKLLLLTRGNVPSALFNAWLLGIRRFRVCVLRAMVELFWLSKLCRLLRVPLSLTLEARRVVAVSETVGLRSPGNRHLCWYTECVYVIFCTTGHGCLRC